MSSRRGTRAALRVGLALLTLGLGVGCVSDRAARREVVELRRSVAAMRRQADADRRQIRALEDRILLLEDKLAAAGAAHGHVELVPELPVVVKHRAPASTARATTSLPGRVPEGAEATTAGDASAQGGLAPGDATDGTERDDAPPLVLTLDRSGEPVILRPAPARPSRDRRARRPTPSREPRASRKTAAAVPRPVIRPTPVAAERLPIVPLADERLPAGSRPIGRAPVVARPDEPSPASPVVVGHPVSVYRAAYQALGRREHATAMAGFRAFLERWPRHAYADNAQYWLAETFYDQGDYRTAMHEFRKVVQRYPDGNKAPDALLKAGYCHVKLGDLPAAREVLARVTRRFPKTQAAKLATARLAEVAAP